MNNYKIISDSSCDLANSYVVENDIEIVPFSVTFDGEKYYRENLDISLEEIYKRMRGDNVFPKTSLPSPQDYFDVFEKYLKDGKDVICLCLTSKFSGSYQSAVNAMNMIKDDYPDRKIAVIDSQNVTASQGYMLMQLVDMKNAGMEFEQIIETAEKIKHDRRIFVTVDTLEFLQKGGRVGKTQALAGSLLNIKPIITFEDGELIPHSKARGRKKALEQIISLCVKDLEEKNVDQYELYVLHIDCPDDADTLVKMFKDRGYTVNLPIVKIGATITVHVGCGTIAVGYFRKYNTI
ncbi:MAG: DegV family protein [Defluviitaleaceae bacterium]|nr:DegV family protein [Defluviitaleaceae bacterium]